MKAGFEGVWVPSAKAQHVVGPEHLTLDLIRRDYIGEARTTVRFPEWDLDGATLMFGVPRWMVLATATAHVKYLWRRDTRHPAWFAGFAEASRNWESSPNTGGIAAFGARPLRVCVHGLRQHLFASRLDPTPAAYCAMNADDDVGRDNVSPPAGTSGSVAGTVTISGVMGRGFRRGGRQENRPKSVKSRARTRQPASHFQVKRRLSNVSLLTCGKSR